jgi:transcriptional regulator with XRE-family HTH domain
VLDLGKKIKKLRSEKKYSAKELSERSGVARSLISQLETGKRQSTSMDTVHRLAQALDAPLSYFFAEETTPASSTTYQKNNSSQFYLNEKNLPYLNTLQKAQDAGITPELLDEFIDLILRMR